MAKMTVTVCDICRDKKRATRHYQIRSEGRKVVVDLCDEDAVPFEALLARAPERTTRSAPARRPKPTTMEEIEALKITK